MKKLLAFAIGTFTASTAFGIQIKTPTDCDHDSYLYFKNKWTVTVNQDDMSSRQEILDALLLTTKGGFSTSLSGYEGPEITVFLSFSESYWSDKEKGEKVRQETLQGLIDLAPGVVTNCSPIFRPAGI